MSDAQSSLDPALSEAAAWFTRLNNRTISHADLIDFRRWRAEPAHASAYAEIERLWGRSASLADDPDIIAAIQAADRHQTLAQWLAGLWRALVSRPVIGVGIALATGLLALLVAPSVLPPAYTTAVGEQRTVRLADGSRVQLDTNSKIRVRLSPGRREIQLVRGQAMFEVARDAARPFVVRAAETRVQALGTRFDVQLVGDGVRVILLEGRVEVTEPSIGKTWALEPGEQLMSAAAASVVQNRPERVDVAAETSWTRGQLVFRDMRLTDAIAQVNRYSRAPIRLRSAALADERVSGVFDADDTEAFLAAITELHPLARSTGSDGAIILTGPNTN